MLRGTPGSRSCRNWKRGSFTVESAVIAPVSFLITAALIALLFYQHNKNWYAMAAEEAALVGNAYILEGEYEAAGEEGIVVLAQEKAEARAEERAQEQPFPGSGAVSEVRVDGWGSRAGYSGEVFSGTVFGAFSWETDCAAERVRVVDLLQKKWLAERVVNHDEYRNPTGQRG